MQDAVINGDGEVMEALAEKSKKQKLQSSSVFDSPVACSSNYEEAAMARLSEILPPVSFTPQPRIKVQYHSCSSLNDASDRRDLSKRSYSFPLLRSVHLRLSPPESPISAAISHPPWDLDIWRQQQEEEEQEEEEEDEIVEVPITVPCRRSKSLRELFDAEKLQGSGVFPARNDGFFSAKSDVFSDVNKLSPISHHAALRSYSSGRATLYELLHSETEDSPQTHKLRSKHKRRRTLSWKLSIQSIRAKFNLSKQTEDQKGANSKKQQTQKSQTAVLPKSGVNLQNKEPQIEILSQEDANSIHKEELSQMHKATFPKADHKPETQQMVKLQRASSQAGKSRPIPRDISGWGKLEVKPPAAMLPVQLTRSGSSQAALTRQASTHEQYYISRKTARVRQRKRTTLPYRENLISFCCCTPAQSSSIP